MNSRGGVAGRSCLPIPHLASSTVYRKGAARVNCRDVTVQVEAQRGEATGSASTVEASVQNPSEWQSASSTAESSFLESSSDDNDTALHLKVENIVKTYDTKRGIFTAVNGVNLDVAPGSLVALLGPSGSGKTTLLRIIAGLEDVTAGKVYFDGENVTDTPVQERNLGMVFQSYALFRHMSIAENVAFGLKVRKLPVDRDQRVAELLDIVELAGLGDRFASQVSGGQRQRVALARALACSPRILLLDEPFGALDALVRKSLRASMKSIVQSLGLTTIIVTHDQDEAFDLADQVVVFNKGSIEQIGTPDDIKTAPASPFVLNFVGDTQSVPSTCQLMRRLKFRTDKPLVMFRPSCVQFFKESDDGLTPVTVVDSRHAGYRILYRAKFDDDLEIEVAVTKEEYDHNIKTFEVGQRLYVKIDHEHLMGYHPDEISNDITK